MIRAKSSDAQKKGRIFFKDFSFSYWKRICKGFPLFIYRNYLIFYVSFLFFSCDA